MINSSPSQLRKGQPACTGVLDYFPLAILAIARLSKAGNDKHNPGQPLHWSRDKSTDHADCLVRHQMERGSIDPETGELHEVSVAWRALAQLQLAEERRLAEVPAPTTTVVVNPAMFPPRPAVSWAEPEPPIEHDGFATINPFIPERF